MLIAGSIIITDLVEFDMCKEIEEYWNKVANNWIEKLKQKEKR